MGPARSESSIMCWSIRASGLSTAKVYFTPGQPGFRNFEEDLNIPCSEYA